MQGCHTKDEIISIVMDKLSPSENETFADIGCGSGRVSLKASKLFGKVYSVDVREELVKKFRKKIEISGIENIEVIHSHGKEFLASAGKIDKIFFGGTKNIEDMLEIASRKSKAFAVNLARVDVTGRVIAKMRELNVYRESLIVNISRGYELAGGIAFRSLNPVFIVIGEARS